MPSKNLFFYISIILSLCLAQPAQAQNTIEPLRDQQVSKLLKSLDPLKVELGKKLFFDRRLSGDGTMSCATCHIPDMLFTDGETISLHYPTTRNWRNAPTLVNMAFNKILFHDGRSQS